MNMHEQAVSAEVLQQAIGWQMRDGTGNSANRDDAEFKAWLNAHPDHARAWRQLGMLDAELQAARGHAVRKVLTQRGRGSAGKRALSAVLPALMLAMALGIWHQYQPLPDLLADEHTVVGERKRVVLPDQTIVHLNTSTAIDLAFDSRRRELRVLKGEVEIETSHANPAENRPFVVTTEDGSMRALGTRFVVRRMADQGTLLSVTQSAVLAWPADCGNDDADCDAARRIEQGQAVLLQKDGLAGQTAANSQVDAWKDGMLVVENMRLADVVRELARYRFGHVQVADAIADLEVSGTFPLDDSDLALSSLVAALPVRLHTRTRYWVEFRPL